MPPTKIPIATGVDELKIVAIADGRAINLKVLEENFVLWFLVIESEVVIFGVRRLVAAFSGALPYRPTPTGLPGWGPRCRANAPLAATSGAVPKFEQSAFNFRHAAHCFN